MAQFRHIVPFRNMRKLLCDKPSFALFTLGLFSLGVAAFVYSIYVQNANSQLINMDVITVWKEMSSQLNQMHYCIEYGKKSSTVHVINPHTFTTTLTMTNDIVNLSAIDANINLTWHPKCDKPVSQNDVVNIQAIRQNGTHTYCALISTNPIIGKYLPFPKRTVCNYDNSTMSNRTLQLSNLTYAKLTPMSKGDICPTGVKTKLVFNTNDKDGLLQFNTFLSDIDKNLVHSRLLMFSYLVAIYIILALIYSFFYKGEDDTSDINDMY